MIGEIKYRELVIERERLEMLKSKGDLPRHLSDMINRELKIIREQIKTAHTEKYEQQ